MAAVAIGNFRILKKVEGEYTSAILVSPSTMDANDTVDVSTLVRDGQLLGVTAWDVDTGDSVTATYAVATGVITVDAAGGDTNHTYSIEIRWAGYNITP